MYLSLLLAACAWRPDAIPPEPPSLPLQAHMGEHLEHAEAVREALISGELEATREAFGWLADHPAVPGEPEEWGGWLDALRAAAARGEASEDLAGAGRALGEVANACGGCHQSLGLTISLPLVGVDPGGDAGHMQRHLWAVEQLWAALIDPSRGGWRPALEALGEPLGEAELGEAYAGVEAWTRAIHEGAAGALADDNPDTRADIFGQLVAACGGCHRELRQ
jgi:cytochrome c553